VKKTSDSTLAIAKQHLKATPQASRRQVWQVFTSCVPSFTAATAERHQKAKRLAIARRAAEVKERRAIFAANANASAG
jgi:hypothetical protein